MPLNKKQTVSRQYKMDERCEFHKTIFISSAKIISYSDFIIHFMGIVYSSHKLYTDGRRFVKSIFFLKIQIIYFLTIQPFLKYLKPQEIKSLVV
jgi:hypothetical protein